jgi:hypothetical protein
MARRDYIYISFEHVIPFFIVVVVVVATCFSSLRHNIFNMIFFSSVEDERKEKREGNVTNPELLFAPLSIQMLLSEFVLALTQPVHVVLDGVCSSSSQ